jgi:signal transduction histidine kinase
MGPAKKVKSSRFAPRAVKTWRRDLSAQSGLAAVVALGLLLLGAVLLNLNLERTSEARRLVLATVGVLEGARAVMIDVVNAETGQRGFLLTGEERYLRPYEEATSRLWADFSALEGRVQMPEQRERLARLRPRIAAKLAELVHTIELRRRSIDEALTVVRTDEGQRLVDEIRAEFGVFETVAKDVLARRTAALEVQARRTTHLALSCGALALLCAGFGSVAVIRRREDRKLVEQNSYLEQQVEERTAALTEVNTELQAFAATVSHDLRAPVRAISGYVDALEEDAGARLQAEELGYLARIGGAAKRMDGLIEDILRYSRLARQDLPTGRVSLEQIIDQALDEQQALLQEAMASVEVLRPLPAVRGHAAAVALGIGNLLSNALKFTFPDRPAEVRVWAERRERRMVRLWVEDQGIGVAAAHQQRIFRPFERLHGREAYPGTGVGLAIVQRVAERLGGRCGVLSTVDQGSRFWIELPAWEEEE